MRKDSKAPKGFFQVTRSVDQTKSTVRTVDTDELSNVKGGWRINDVR